MENDCVDWFGDVDIPDGSSLSGVIQSAEGSQCLHTPSVVRDLLSQERGPEVFKLNIIQHDLPFSRKNLR